ncbi:hypothetical protein AND_010081 [Anopheles darlingi]|uniref:Uncharacterized protein n=1 Tax=Anopheles darlingi TaxID=43151 RepID=W5J265_ANODA|nr:hypothetical protein AND_010081 [Anopheles darlingi]
MYTLPVWIPPLALDSDLSDTELLRLIVVVRFQMLLTGITDGALMATGPHHQWDQLTWLGNVRWGKFMFQPKNRPTSACSWL